MNNRHRKRLKELKQSVLALREQFAELHMELCRIYDRTPENLGNTPTAMETEAAMALCAWAAQHLNKVVVDMVEYQDKYVRVNGGDND